MSTKAIEQFLQTAYTDEKLAALLAHAEDGKLAYESCCCLAGFPDARHAYQGSLCEEEADVSTHGPFYWNIDNARDGISLAFQRLGIDDAARRAKLIPLIKAEIARRDSLKTPANTWDNNVALEECFVPVLTK
jgi:hypothetical protein